MELKHPPHSVVHIPNLRKNCYYIYYFKRNNNYIFCLFSYAIRTCTVDMCCYHGNVLTLRYGCLFEDEIIESVVMID